MNCARCRRPLKHPIELAGMQVGRQCAKAIADALELQHGDSRAPAPADPRQTDLFAVPDLFEAMA